MNQFLINSIDYAQQCNYLDCLYSVYPTIPNGVREIDNNVWIRIEKAFHKKDNKQLILNMLDLDLMPIKDSYISYLKRDRSAIDRNPQTINRLAGELYCMGLTKMYEACSKPKEANRQIGPMFKNWVKNKSLGIEPVNIDIFSNSSENAILDASDQEMKDFAEQYLNYHHDKGLDFLARFNNKYVIGEAKFITDFGGHQNAQYQDAILTLQTHVANNVIKIAILDGVLYIKGNNKMYKSLVNKYANQNIMSALVLRNFLYSI